jgi:hypothetical protein
MLRWVKAQTQRMQRDEAAQRTCIYLQFVHHSIIYASYTAVCVLLPILFNSWQPSHSAVMQIKRDSTWQVEHTLICGENWQNTHCIYVCVYIYIRICTIVFRNFLLIHICICYLRSFLFSINYLFLNAGLEVVKFWILQLLLEVHGLILPLGLYVLHSVPLREYKDYT